MPNTYIALTIGPIYKTLQSVKSTKAIWATSFMFSKLVREIMEPFAKTNKSFLMPYAARTDYFDKVYGVGLFPDRFIFVGDEKDYDRLRLQKEAVIEQFAKDASTNFKSTRCILKNNHYSGNRKLEEELGNYLTDYLKIYTLKADVPEDQNPMLQVNDYLDNLELQDNYLPIEELPYLKDLFENVYYNFLVEEGFYAKRKEKYFPSTVEISTAPLQVIDAGKYKEAQKPLRQAEGKDKDKTESQQTFLKELRRLFGDDVRFHHKYIAVVQADGDNMGEFIKKLFENHKDPDGTIIEIKDRFTAFSKQLMAFSLAAVQLIKAFKGTTVYAGGDDLLFFAPVAFTGGWDVEGIEELFTGTEISNAIKEYRDDARTQLIEEPETKSIFWLINKIDLLFRYFILENEKLKSIISKAAKKPSMSYGMSISFYKFPLNEALEQGANQLFYTAKKSESKNAVSWSVLKHSGQYFGTTFTKSTETFNQFLNMLNISLDSNGSFIASLMYKLESQKYVLEHAAIDETALAAFFDNNFNEKIHLGAKNDYLKDVQKLIAKIFKEEPSHSLDEKIKHIYGALRFIHFLLAKYNDND